VGLEPKPMSVTVQAQHALH